MGTEQLVGLLIQFGPAAIDIAEHLIARWDKPVTLADLEELRALGKRTAHEALDDALLRNGVPVESQLAIDLRRLVH